MSKKSNVLDMTPAEARTWIRRVMGPPRRVLEGAEREQVLTMLALIGPTATTNNQHSWAEDYVQGNHHWCVTHFPNQEAIVEEIERDLDQ
jgi:hypothetical protein